MKNSAGIEQIALRAINKKIETLQHDLNLMLPFYHEALRTKNRLERRINRLEKERETINQMTLFDDFQIPAGF